MSSFDKAQNLAVLFTIKVTISSDAKNETREKFPAHHCIRLSRVFASVFSGKDVFSKMLAISAHSIYLMMVVLLSSCGQSPYRKPD